MMLVGASQFIQQLFQCLFLTNCTQLSELVRTGKLDFMLLLPANTRFLVSLRQVDLGGFLNAASAIAVMIYAAHQLHLGPRPPASLGIRRSMRRRRPAPLLPHVHPRHCRLLDRPRAGNYLGILQLV